MRQVDPGNYVTAAGNTPMLVITQLHPIAVVFTLPEDQLQEVAQQMRQGALEVDAYSRDDQTKLATGKLLTIDNQIDQTTGTVKLKAIFDNQDNSLWPNQFVNAHLLLETRKNAITAPASAMQRGPDGTFAYVVDANNTVQMRPVQVALTQGATVVIASGLQGGDQVVTDGQEKLQAGMRVAPQAPARQNQQTQRQHRIDRHEYFAAVYSAAHRDFAVDGGTAAGGHCGLPAVAHFRPAAGGLSDHPGGDVLSRRQSRT